MEFRIPNIWTNFSSSLAREKKKRKHIKTRKQFYMADSNETASS